MILPSEVPHGRPVPDLTQALNHLIRYCRSITPRPSATVGVETFANGTTFRVRPAEGARGGGGAAAAQTNAAFHARISAYDDEGDEYTVAYKGGTVTFFAGASTTLAAGTATSSDGADLYAYLLYTPGEEGADGEWTLEIDDENSAYPTPSDGEIVVPLWHFDYAEAGGGTLTQETEGGVIIPAVRNVVDTDA